MNLQGNVHGSPAAEPGRAVRILRGAPRLLGGLTVAALIFVVVGEMLARSFDLVDVLNGYDRQLYMPGPDGDLPYLLRPGVRTRVFGYDVRVNEFGCRGPEIAAKPPPGVRRVLVLGDSVVFGLGMPENETVAAKLDWMLDGKIPTEVINAGVQGYDAVAEARWLEWAGVRLRPSVIVVGVSLNDYDPPSRMNQVGVLTRSEAGPARSGLAERSHLFFLLRWLDQYRRGTLYFQLVERLDEKWRSRAQPDDDARPTGPEAVRLPGESRQSRFYGGVKNLHLTFYRDPDPARWDRLRTAWAGMKRLADRDGIALVVAIFPEGYQFGEPNPDLVPQQRLLDLCAELGIRCIDLHPAFMAAGGKLFLDPQHPNARGHSVAALTIALAIRRK